MTSAPSSQYGISRFWEIVPGALTWSVLLGSLILGFVAPSAAVVFIILFDLFWTLRVLYFIIHVFAAYRSYRLSIRTPWRKLVADIPGHDRLYHLVLFPTYKEELSIVDDALASLLKADIDPVRTIVVVGGEERAVEQFRDIQEALKAKYHGKFGALLFTVHPKDLPGEIPGKGSNLKHMGGEVKKLIDERGIPYDDIIVHSFDIDTIAHPQYYACLEYQFLTVPDPTHCSYQPVTLFSNNIWTAAAPVRISSFGTTFWLLGELVRPERMWTFSSHSMSWRMLIDVGFWEPDVVSEDSRIFMQAFLHYGGKYRIVPIYLPVSMDTVASGSYRDSLKDLYKQQRRWAFGVEHIPYMVRMFRQHPELPWTKKAVYLFNHFEGMLSWSSAPFIIFFLGYIPFWTVGDVATPLLANAPYVLEAMMRIATMGLFVTGGMSFLLLPPRPRHLPKSTWLVMVLQWVMLPVSTILFGAIPAIDAQTRLMLGKYLGFNVTKKVAASRT